LQQEQELEEVVETPCDGMSNIQKNVPSALVTDECHKVADLLDLCKLDNVAFQRMYSFMGPSSCQGCECREPTDRQCVESCSAKALFIAQVRCYLPSPKSTPARGITTAYDIAYTGI
jgi:hypothetical protein